MVPIERRTFVVASGVAASAFAGCLSRPDDESDGDDEGNETLPEDLQAVLDPIPASVDGSSIRHLGVNRPAMDAQDFGVAGYFDAIGVDPSRIDRVATATYDSSSRAVTAFTGTFAESDVSVPEAAAVSVSDGLALLAAGRQSEWTAGLEAATGVTDDPDAGLVADAAVQSLFGPLADAQEVQVYPIVDEETTSSDADFDTDAVEAIGNGTTNDLDAREQTVTIVAVFSPDASPDEAVLEEIVRTANGEVPSGGLDVETDDRRATTTFTRDLPRSELPDHHPDVRLAFEYDSSTGVVTITHDGDGDAIDASKIELRIGGDPVEAPWADAATIEAGDSFEVEAPLHSLVRVVWIDPNVAGLEYSLGGLVVGLSDAFEASYDREAREFTITYTGSEPLDADGFVVRRSEAEFEGYDVLLTEFADSLETGSEVVVPDEHGVGDLQLLYTPDGDASLPPESVFWHEAAHSGGEGSDAGTSHQGSGEDGASDGADE